MLGTGSCISMLRDITALLLLPSLMLKLTVRVTVLGVPAVSLYVTARKAACHCASVAVPPLEVSVNTPVPAL
ncbi:hypothetical protein D3C72_2144320 [compost metagenome]